MTLKQFRLSPASGDDGGSALSGFELGTCAQMQFIKGVGIVISQRMDRIEFRCVSGQQFDDDVTVDRIQVVAHQSGCGAAWPRPR